jgi:protein TonB
VPENRYLSALCTVSAAAILVCSALLLLNTLSDSTVEPAAPIVGQASRAPGQTTRAKARPVSESDELSQGLSGSPAPAEPEYTTSTPPISLATTTTETPEPEPVSEANSAEQASGEGLPAVEATPPVAMQQTADQSPEVPPLPIRRTPVIESSLAERVAETPQRRTDSRPRWHPMTLGESKDSANPAAKASGLTQSAYRSKLWAALARHKPRLGQPGCTTVTFAIGPSGALRSLRVSRSSGNTSLDRRALATVRQAAPFPPPPTRGAVAYTIQIYFR